MANKTRFRLYPNVHKCASCGEQVLPDPIVFSKCSRLDGTYVCDRCYADHNYTLACEETCQLMDAIDEEQS